MGSKSSKRTPSIHEHLDREAIDKLCEETKFTEEELLNWHTNFYKDCPDGKLTLKQFEQQYAKIMGKPTQKTADYIRHMFTVYDQDKNQFIDFREFVMALSAASVINRLRLVETIFHIFDLDHDGKITKEEIGKMLHTLVDVTNSNQKRRRQQQGGNEQQQKKQIDLQKRIDDAFNELNANDDDHITKDEFIEWYMKSGLISDVQSTEADVADSSRIQEIGKKSRKLLRQVSHMKPNSESGENRQRQAQIIRHMSRMVEKKSHSVGDVDDDNDDDDDDNQDNHRATTVSSSRHHNYSTSNNERVGHRPNIQLGSISDDTESQSSKENDRWQHLFNSVLGQIRTQRTTEQSNGQNNFGSWRHEAEERSKMEYMKQKSAELQNNSYLSTGNNVLPQSTTTTMTSYGPPPSPDIVTVRL